MGAIKKAKQCLNCNQELSEDFDFCPFCGQKNSNHNISFGQLTGDFFNSYFSLDSRFFRSIPPFLFKPGALTIRFNEGKRKAYANPVRLYIIVSFIYFFIISLQAGDLSKDVKPINSDTVFDNEEDSLKELVVTDPTDSTIHVRLTPTDSTEEYVIETQGGNNITIDTSAGWLLNPGQWKILLDKNTADLSEQELFDSLKVEDKSAFDKRFIRQMIRVKLSDKEYFFAFILKNLSIMMFLMLPIFALILKLLYVRRKALYIQHLVHTLHIHSFAFLIYSLSDAIGLWIYESNWIDLISVILVTLYCFLSFLNVYRQSFMKTIFKFILTGSFYSVLLIFATFIEILLSMMFF